MTMIKVSQDMTREALREQLKSFGAFSAVKASIDDKNPDIIILHEVTIAARLWDYCRLSKEERNYARRESKNALIKLAKQYPNIEKVFGDAILFKTSWTKHEMQKQLEFEATPLKGEKNSKGLKVPIARYGNAGITDAKLSEVEADCRIVWALGPATRVGGNMPLNEGNCSKEEIQGVQPDNPTADDIDFLYGNALKNAVGHVLIAPIADVPVEERAITRDSEQSKSANSRGNQPVSVVGYLSAYSDNSIMKLLEAIHDAQKKNPDLKVTICTGDLDDKDIFSRVLDQQAIFETTKRHENRQSNIVVSMPESLKIIQGGGKDGISVNQVAIDESSLTIYKTKYENIKFCCTDPGKLSADTAFLEFYELDIRAQELQLHGHEKFSQVVEDVFESSGVVQTEALAIRKTAFDKWGMEALELPPCELPAMKLYAFHNLESTPLAKEQVKDFFESHLHGLTGRVVIQITGNATLDQGLADALSTLAEKPGEFTCEVLLASADPSHIEQFLKFSKFENQFAADLAPVSAVTNSSIFMSETLGKR